MLTEEEVLALYQVDRKFVHKYYYNPEESCFQSSLLLSAWLTAKENIDAMGVNGTYSVRNGAMYHCYVQAIVEHKPAIVDFNYKQFMLFNKIEPRLIAYSGTVQYSFYTFIKPLTLSKTLYKMSRETTDYWSYCVNALDVLECELKVPVECRLPIISTNPYETD